MFRMKKVCAFILALIMVCSLASASARADEEAVSEAAAESVIEENNVEETVDEEVEEEFEPEVEGEYSTVESDEKPAESEAVQGVTVESITVEENSVDETPSEEKSFDEITETPKKSGSNRSSESYVLTAGEELHIPYILGTETVRASFVPEESGYYNFNYDAGANVMTVRLSVLNAEEGIYINHDVNTWGCGYHTLEDVFLTAGRTYYYEAEYTGAATGSDTDYLMMSVSISENERKCSDNVYWDLTEDGILTIYGNGPIWWSDGWKDKPVTQVVIEAGITWIGDNAFSDCTSITNVTIPETVVSIGDGAFYGCKSFTSINIPNAVTSIGGAAFANCTSLISVNIPNTITSIGSSAFQGCISLASVNIPDAITSIEGWAFQGCISLASVNIPDTITSIGGYAFQGCISLTSVNIPNSVTTIGGRAFYECTSLNTIFYGGTCNAWANILKEGGNEVLDEIRVVCSDGEIGMVTGSFGSEGDNLTWELRRNGVLTISGTGAMNSFLNASTPWNHSEVKELVVEEGVTSIGQNAFAGHSALTKVTLPETLQRIEEKAFSNAANLSDILIPQDVNYIGDDAFYSCRSLVSISLPNGIEQIGVRAFQSCSGLCEVIIPDNVSTIGSYAFSNCTSLETIELPSNVTLLEDGSFNGCWNLKSIVLPTGISCIEPYSFSGCRSLTSLVIPDNVTSIKEGAFSNCNGLETIVLPDSLKTIGYKAFCDCSSLNNIVLPDTVRTIGDEAFANCTSLESISIPYGVRCLQYVFSGCRNLTNVELPNSLTDISFAFWNCSALENIDLPDSITNIDYTFCGCSSLREIVIPYNVTSISGGTFHECSSLNTINIPANVTEMSLYIDGTSTQRFWGCNSLVEIKVDEENECFKDINGVLFNKEGTSLLEYPFGLPNREYVIPEGVESIETFAFLDCSNLETIYIPPSVTYIGTSAFQGAEKLSRVHYMGTQDQWYRISIETGNEVLDEIEIGFFPVTGQCTDSITWSLDGSGNLIITGEGDIPSYSGMDNDSPWSVYSELIKHIEIEDGITSIGNRAFYGCTNAVDVIIPDSVTAIHSEVFAGCTSLTRIDIPDSVTFIGTGAFRNCTSLAYVTIPDSVTETDSYVFENCTSLTEITLPGSIYFLVEGMFFNCTSLTDVIISDSTTAIGPSLFEGCVSLARVTIPDSVTNIYVRAFEGCSALSDVYYTGSQAEWESIVIRNNNESLQQANIHYLADTPSCIVTVTSSGDGISSSIAPVYGGGSYLVGDTVTVGASIVSGFTFIGWTVNGITVSTEPEYTFTVEGDTELVAIYQIKNEVTYSLKITGVDFIINGIPQNNSYHESFASGTEVELCYYGSDTFLRWENTSNQPQSIEPTITLTMNRNYELKVITVRGIPGDDTNGYYAYVEFISPYDQVMSASTWSSKDSYLSHALPGSVSKSGYSFAGWTMDGENAAGTKDIIASIDASHSYIGLTALMEVLDTPRTVTVFDAEGNTTEKQVNLGKTVTLKAGTVSGKTFKCWALDAQGSIPLSYGAAYSFKVTTDISVYAIYVNAGENVTALPVAASTGVYAFIDGGKNKLSFTGNFDVPEGYTVVEYGLLYGTKASEFTDAETADQKLVYGSENTYVKQQASTFRLKRDSYEYLINVTGYLNNYVYAKAYLVVINNSTGEQEVYYGRLMYGTYNNLSSSGS